jgi:hypothetical protein
MPSSTDPPLPVRVSGALLFFTGVGILVAFNVSVWEAKRAQAWPSVQGMFRSVQLNCLRRGCNLLADYVYHVADPQKTPEGTRDTGRVYSGTRITFGDGGMSYPDQLLIVNRYRPGASVRVFYDPRDPGNAVLEPRSPPTPALIWWIDGLFVGGGALIVMISLWRRLAAMRG